MKNITLIPGDGIGPEITGVTRRVLEESGTEINWETVDVSDRDYSEVLAEILDSLTKNTVGLKGPVTTRILEGDRSLTVAIRQELDLYANIRPIEVLPGIGSGKPIDFVVVRENTEGLYSGLNFEIDDQCAQTIKLTTKRASQRIARKAYEYALEEKRKKVTTVHKANVVQAADGLFLQTVREVSDQYPGIKSEEIIVDNMCMQLVQEPEQFDVILAPNLYGDIISDLSAGLMGGLGVAPGANIGEDLALFEAAHGSAPDIAGQNKANPLALLRSAVMMLEYIGQNEPADRIQEAVRQVIAEKDVLTPDLGGKATTSQVSDEIISKMKGHN